MKRRKMRVRYRADPESAEITTGSGYYFCTVDRCSEERRRKFRQRVRGLQEVVENYPYPILTLDPDVC